MIDLKSEAMPENLKKQMATYKAFGWLLVVLALVLLASCLCVHSYSFLVAAIILLIAGIYELVYVKTTKCKYYTKRAQLLKDAKDGKWVEDQNQQIYMDPVLGPIDLASTELPGQIARNIKSIHRSGWSVISSAIVCLFFLVILRSQNLGKLFVLTFVMCAFYGYIMLWYSKKLEENYYKKRTEIIEKVKQGKIRLKVPEEQRNWEHHMCCNVCGTIFVYTDDDMAKNNSHKFHSVVSSLLSAVNAQTGNRYDMYEQRKIADREKSQIWDYSRCPHCHSTDIVEITQDEAKRRNSVKSGSEVASVDTLKKYKELLDMGAITQEEFDEKKKQLLNL